MQLPFVSPLGLLLLASLLTACAPAGSTQPSPGIHALGGTRASIAPGPFLPLSTSGATIRDAAGRQVILRGLQHHALQDVRYGGREIVAGDLEQIASWGFTTLRMAISWSRIEPLRGQYDDAYLAEIKSAMDAAQAAGLTVILEWHHDAWGKCSQAPDSSAAPNANGAPDWTCPADYKPSLLGFTALFDRLWTNTDGLLDSYIAAWLHVAKKLGEHPALLGYDLHNEPNGSESSPELERDFIYPAYRKLIAAMRGAGVKGIFFLDAPIFRNESTDLYTESFADAGKDLVFAPHLYTSWVRLYILQKAASQADKEADFAAAEKQAAGLGLPLWNGEWGVNLFLPTADEDLERHVSLEDRFRIGSSYWAFQRAVPNQGDDSISGGQSILNTDRSVRWNVVNRLSRPYPVQTPGTLTALQYDFLKKRLDVTANIDQPAAGPMIFYVPARQLGKSICVSVKGPGTWSWDIIPETERLLISFGAAGVYSVTISPCI